MNNERTSSSGQRSKSAEFLPGPQVPNCEDGSFEAGLWALAQVAEEGESFSLHAIGAVCGVSHEAIRKIEIKAMRTLRRRLRQAIGILDERELNREKHIGDRE